MYRYDVRSYDGVALEYFLYKESSIRLRYCVAQVDESLAELLIPEPSRLYEALQGSGDL